MTRKRWAVLGGVGVVLLLMLLIGTCGSGVQVEGASVQRGPLQVVVEEEGRTRVRDRFVVAAPISGALQRIDLREGTTIAAGEVLARIASAPDDPRGRNIAQAQLAAAEARRSQVAAELEQAQATALQAQREAARREELADAGALSREEMERMRLRAETARQQADAILAALRAVEADVSALRAALEGSTPQSGGPTVAVTAPTSGRVLRVLEESERVVQAGTPLLEIGDASGIEVVVDVLSADAVRIASGNRVLVDEWGGERTLQGRVRLVEPAAFTEVSALGVEEQRVKVIVDLVDSPPELGAGFRVEARIVVWEDDAVLTVPTSALFQRDGTWWLFVVEGGRARERQVQLGQRGIDAAEVRGGVEEGETIIVFPSDEVADGVRVSLSD